MAADHASTWVVNIDAVAVRADPDRSVAELERPHRGGMRQAVREVGAVADGLERTRRRVVACEALTPTASPDDARSILQQRANAIAPDAGLARRVVPDVADDLQRAGIDDLDAAAKGCDPHLARSDCLDAVHPVMAGSALRRGGDPAKLSRARIQHRSAVLGRADPDASARVLIELRHELSGERSRSERIGRDALEAPGLAPDLQTVAAAHPQLSGAIDQQAARAIVGETGGVGWIGAEVIDDAGAWVEAIQAFIRGDPDATGAIFDEPFDTVVRESRARARVAAIRGEPIGGGVVHRHAGAERAGPDAAVRRGEQRADVAPGQGVRIRGIGAEDAEPKAVVAHQPALRANPQEPVSVLRQGRTEMRGHVVRHRNTPEGESAAGRLLAAGRAGGREQRHTRRRQEEFSRNQADSLAHYAI